MNRTNLGAVRLSFLTAAVLAFLAAPVASQVVERGRTWDDLVASHPCASGLTGRIARVTDCDAADDVGDGGGAFQCWVSCDGSAPWVTQAIGAGGGGLPGAGEVTEAMFKAVDAAGDEECLTYESTVGDFEWQSCSTSGAILGAPLTATDNLPICTDGTGGSTIGACTVAAFPAGSAGAPSITLGTATTGFYRDGDVGANAFGFVAGTPSLKFLQAEVSFVSNGLLTWGNQVNTWASSSNDTGFKKQATGVLTCTDGGSGRRCLLGGGTAIASATALPVPTGSVVHVTGTTTITSITSTNFQSGVCVVLIFDGVLTFTDGSNLKLAGDFVTTADDTITVCYDGTNWHETARSIN